jgi:mRNA-degrading endonuclease RelE of RelBE toxin-antitoxin system
MMTREEWRMSASKRATVYLDPELHKALRLKSAETARTVSDLVNEAVRDELAEDADDLAVFEARKDEGLVTFEDFVKAGNPRPPQSAKLSGDDKYRLRCGVYRVLYQIEDDRLVVYVIRVRHRREAYRN